VIAPVKVVIYNEPRATTAHIAASARGTFPPCSCTADASHCDAAATRAQPPPPTPRHANRVFTAALRSAAAAAAAPFCRSGIIGPAEGDHFICVRTDWAEWAGATEVGEEGPNRATLGRLALRCTCLEGRLANARGGEHAETDSMIQ
jgi:hypothetical protein